MKYTKFRPVIRSRHPSHAPLRRHNNKLLPLFPFKSVIRFGSSTDIKDTITNGGNRIEINTIDSIQNSSNKLRMKECFRDNNVITADWWTMYNRYFYYQDINDENTIKNVSNLPYPIIAKNIYGSKGRGNYKLDNKDSLNKFLENKNNIKDYIFEKFYNYSREYRLHVSSEDCFYTCRKMLKSDTPQNKRWYRNDDNSIWVLEENESFDKPVNWNNVVSESIKSLKSVGLDIGAVDLRIQSATTKKGNKRKEPKFIIVEINSAPSFGEITLQKYINEIPKILLNKKNE